MSSSRNSPRLYGPNGSYGMDAQIPIPQNFVVTACYTNKIKFSWTAVSSNLYKNFKYEILAEQNNLPNGQPKLKKATLDHEVIIENVIPGQEYKFYVRAVETSTTLPSEYSQELDIKIPKDSKNKINHSFCTPRAAKWTSNNVSNKVMIEWKSPHYFYGEVSYELLFNDKVLGRCYVPPLVLNKTEIEKFEFAKGSFKLRSIIINKEKTESNSIPIPYPIEIRDAFTEEVKEEKKEIEQSESSMIYVWVCAPDPMPDLKLIPYGDPDFSTYSFAKLDEDNGLYMCCWPSHFINDLDHYFLFGIGDPKINLAAMPTFDEKYKGYWKVPKGSQIKFFVIYTTKVLHRFAHAIAGGVSGMHHKYKDLLECIVNNIDNGITFKTSMKTIITMHKQWEQQSQTMYNELQSVFFKKLELYADSVEYWNLSIKQISVILLSMYWLLSRSHHKVHYRHLHHSLNGLLTIVNSDKNEYSNVIDLITDICGIYVVDLLKLFQSFAIEKLKKDRSRYFDLVWYQIIYLSAIKVINESENINESEIDIESIHKEFMVDIDQILFNPNCLARPIGSEDLQSITKIYIALLKPVVNDNQFYQESGVKLEELLIENHIKCEDILDTITFINKYKFSYHIFALILYRNQHSYTFSEYSNGKEYLPELNIASDQKTSDLLGKYGKFTFVQQQKIPKPARCCLIHLIFNQSFKSYKEFDERNLFFWFGVIKKLILKYKDFQVSDQILYEIRQFDTRMRETLKQKQRKQLKKSLNNAVVLNEFERSISVYLSYAFKVIPGVMLDASLMNSKNLNGLLSVLLYFRHKKVENIDNENKDDFIWYLFGILMLELNELFFAEKYLMKAVYKRPNNPYGHYYTDMALLNILNNNFISAFNYISQALNKKHTEPYNKLILLYLYHQLSEYNKRKLNIASKRFDMNGMLLCDYLSLKNQNNMVNDKDQKLINQCLSNYYNALKCLKLQQWQESMRLIDEIYKFINNINIKQMKNSCRQIIDQIKQINRTCRGQNEALITEGNANCLNSSNDEDSKYNNDEQKEQSPQRNDQLHL